MTVPVTVLAKKPDGAGKANAHSQKEHHEGSAGKHQSTSEDSERSDKARRFNDEEQRRVREHYLGDQSDHRGKGKKKEKRIPPGLQKKLERGGELPPGWQNKVAVGEVLDSDLYSRSEPLPDELESVLGRVAGEEHRRIGHKVIKVLEGDATVIDVIDILDGM
ncbi:conserved hypothetical protein [Amphritea japonica ATCC BAA-1530]|uniref:Uncharacterized protein n=2 Tax=Amphritea TaxID=515417 RepID=A0A7R6PAY5_9GAMM|nr:conserved hypothetical protein [Amphritea japonica ATCC BAA-1530]